MVAINTILSATARAISIVSTSYDRRVCHPAITLTITVTNNVQSTSSFGLPTPISPIWAPGRNLFSLPTWGARDDTSSVVTVSHLPTGITNTTLPECCFPHLWEMRCDREKCNTQVEPASLATVSSYVRSTPIFTPRPEEMSASFEQGIEHAIMVSQTALNNDQKDVQQEQDNLDSEK
jgi:hypothetical protein